jgi:hypothetical protein
MMSLKETTKVKGRTDIGIGQEAQTIGKRAKRQKKGLRKVIVRMQKRNAGTPKFKVRLFQGRPFKVEEQVV